MPDIEIFTGPNCGYCARAKALLEREGHAFRELSVDDPSAMAQFRRRLPRAKTIPQIFVDGEHIGGCEDLEIAVAEGRL
jgi:glutaredoxin 3